MRIDCFVSFSEQRFYRGRELQWDGLVGLFWLGPRCLSDYCQLCAERSTRDAPYCCVPELGALWAGR